MTGQKELTRHLLNYAAAQREPVHPPPPTVAHVAGLLLLWHTAPVDKEYKNPPLILDIAASSNDANVSLFKVNFFVIFFICFKF